MGSHNRSDAINGVLIFIEICFSSINRFLQVFSPWVTGITRAPNFMRATLAPFCNIHFSHINIAFQAKISSSRSQCNPMLPGTCFCNDLFRLKFGQSPSPIQWFSLWAPVWFRSSRFRYIWQLPMELDKRSQWHTGVGRP